MIIIKEELEKIKSNSEKVLEIMKRSLINKNKSEKYIIYLQHQSELDEFKHNKECQLKIKELIEGAKKQIKVNNEIEDGCMNLFESYSKEKYMLEILDKMNANRIFDLSEEN